MDLNKLVEDGHLSTDDLKMLLKLKGMDSKQVDWLMGESSGGNSDIGDNQSDKLKLALGSSDTVSPEISVNTTISANPTKQMGSFPTYAPEKYDYNEPKVNKYENVEFTDIEKDTLDSTSNSRAFSLDVNSAIKERPYLIDDDFGAKEPPEWAIKQPESASIADDDVRYPDSEDYFGMETIEPLMREDLEEMYKSLLPENKVSYFTEPEREKFSKFVPRPIGFTDRLWDRLHLIPDTVGEIDLSDPTVKEFLLTRLNRLYNKGIIKYPGNLSICHYFTVDLEMLFAMKQSNFDYLINSKIDYESFTEGTRLSNHSVSIQILRLTRAPSKLIGNAVNGVIYNPKIHRRFMPAQFLREITRAKRMSEVPFSNRRSRSKICRFFQSEYRTTFCTEFKDNTEFPIDWARLQSKALTMKTADGRIKVGPEMDELVKEYMKIGFHYTLIFVNDFNIFDHKIKDAKDLIQSM